MEKIMVVGAGQMGAGIAQVCAQAGFHVVLHDIDLARVEKGFDRIVENVRRQREKGKITEQDENTTLQNIEITTDLHKGKDRDLVIEAAIEKMDTKKQIFRQLDKITPKTTILATNTSSLPITELASATNRPEKVIGMHFMNPVPVMKLVEIIRGLATSDETYLTVKKITEQIGKVPVEVNDFPGFISNRVLMPMINEAVYALQEGVATKEAIDEIMKLGMNHPMGPLELADFIGLDTCLYIMEILHQGLGDDKYRPCPLLRKYVNAGWLGKKNGRGFYVYE
ncbi:3-hydroxybutyryl-CoA dehydrogenase [Fervidibacillus halotolerans]|uniref:3-hydroxybutyryl-CoA dehydrogenase n=1 Tax=Fervidibacillus halotolerans TaxID=2980027 RepID=A0A9E8LYR7_9BACI|nr:3-hydroxybutyryl-CoA dehydrogenase [Fervidibacillus halotolerans]WAA12205.1 3-hydroxybutyryl-CoA dehydrogenase [Fervidibacillus halotolerans]